MKFRTVKHSNPAGLDLKVLESASSAVKDAFYFSQWLVIQRGNDCY
jgi:hypothetical protein